MPRRDDIQSILIIGSGPIVIGQACEFDYSGTQACRALKEEGFRVILLNSNPATIMTDPEFADATYVEPITVEFLERIIAKEKPDAILPTLGGQTALNVAYQAVQTGVLERHGVEMLGVSYEALDKAEDRELFARAMAKIGLQTPEARYVSTLDEALDFLEEQEFPLVVRPYYTLGGAGGSIIYNLRELKEKVGHGLRASMVHKVLLEKSVIGWKEFEMEVMRDRKDNVVIICSIENIDPMGVHTGDSITVAPSLTLTDSQLQELRDASIKIIREIGVETGGSNVQFAVNPDTGEINVIEMNPRVSRSSALASKATGFPIAKIAAKLAVGYTLDELPNDITRKTPASFEPSLDYIVVKMPRFAFEKFSVQDPTLTTTMYSVGEAMAIGRSFREAFQKCLRSQDQYLQGFFHPKLEARSLDDGMLEDKLRRPNPDRMIYIKMALNRGFGVERIYALTKIDRWFLWELERLVGREKALIRAAIDRDYDVAALDPDLLLEAKQDGFSDAHLAWLFRSDASSVRMVRQSKGIQPVFKQVDTCSAEFESETPYFYSCYDQENEAQPAASNKRVVIIGGGPNRIGQGIEFDYCCVHASMALQAEGYEAIMINSNPETVSTDYDVSTRLYFEPLTVEDILRVIDIEQPMGVIVQFGGQTSINLAEALQAAGVKILGTSVQAIDTVEDRNLFMDFIRRTGLRQPDGATTTSIEETARIAEDIGYPLMVRPSYVLGGRSMQIVYDLADLLSFFKLAVDVDPDHPVLIDRFLQDAREIDVDALSDGRDCVVAAVMEHIHEAGIHSGDSACALPSYSLPPHIHTEIIDWTRRVASALRVEGLLNIQFALKEGQLYIIEVNPRASRTVPFASKVSGIPWAKLATQIMLGKTVAELGVSEPVIAPVKAVKEAVIPFSRFPVIRLGPEMRATGEVMGIDDDFGRAFIKSQLGVYQSLPTKGSLFVSVDSRYYRHVIPIVRRMHELGWKLYATDGTSKGIASEGLPVTRLKKIHEGSLNVVELMQENKIDLIINIPSLGKKIRLDEQRIRTRAIEGRVPIVSTIASAEAFAAGLESLVNQELDVCSLQSWYRRRSEAFS